MKISLSQQTLNKLTSVATIGSLVAVPILVAVIGYKIQSSISNESIKKDYVQMAIQILAEEPKVGVHEDLREWAIDILAKNSPVPFTAALKKQLSTNPWLGVTLREFAGESEHISHSRPMPPSDLMNSPKPLLAPTNKNLEENLRISKENALQLKELQGWINKKHQEEITRDKFFKDLDKNSNDSKER